MTASSAAARGRQQQSDAAAHASQSAAWHKERFIETSLKENGETGGGKAAILRHGQSAIKPHHRGPWKDTPRARGTGNASVKCPGIGHPHPAAISILAGRCVTSVRLLYARSQNELRAIINPAGPKIERLPAAYWLGEESGD
jgi:hypothetical protein